MQRGLELGCHRSLYSSHFLWFVIKSCTGAEAQAVWVRQEREPVPERGGEDTGWAFTCWPLVCGGRGASRLSWGGPSCLPASVQGVYLPFISVGLQIMHHLPINPHCRGEMQMKLSLMCWRHNSNF